MTVLGYSVDPRIDLGVDNMKKTRTIMTSINDNDMIIATAGMEAILPTVLARAATDRSSAACKSIVKASRKCL